MITLSISFATQVDKSLSLESIFYFTLLFACLVFKLVDASDFLFDFKKPIKVLYRSNDRLLFYSQEAVYSITNYSDVKIK